ncbi:MAG TPA: hypothetical protein VF988_07850 [Verrucomicrobiae bacterium]
MAACIAVFCGRPAWAADVPLTQRPWYVVNTAHFNIYSCGELGKVYKLAARLEQFSSAYAQLAGAQAVQSPPIVVLAFPDHTAMTPYLPLYEGHPISMAAFFQHGHDENLIVLSLPERDLADMGLDVIFHEYAHLLFRRNDQIWPLWLKEGMAEIYSTFQTSGGSAQIANPIGHHLRALAREAWLPLPELFAVNHDSATYNEQNRQGIFYAESWLLTHYLICGDNAQHVAALGRYTELLQQGQLPVQAFTNAVQMPLPILEAELRRYLARGVFRPLELSLKAQLTAPVSANTHPIAPAELLVRLGDELLRIQRFDAAEARFDEAKKLAPGSPFPEEGLGLLAHERKNHGAALRHLKAAMALDSRSFLAYYLYAQETYAETASGNRYRRLDGPVAGELRQVLGKSIALMPDFAPAHELLGFFEMVQGDNLTLAGEHLVRAIQLEPENRSYLLALAQLQLHAHKPEAARQTLQPLLLPNVDADVRAEAQTILSEIGKRYP